VPLVLLLADRQAEVGALVEAVNALAALGGEEGDDMVARRQPANVRPDRLDDPGALVTEHGRRITGRVGARGGVEVRVADPARVQTNQHLPIPRLRQLDLLHHERLTELLQHRRPHSHRARAPGAVDNRLHQHSRYTGSEMPERIRTDDRLNHN